MKCLAQLSILIGVTLAASAPAQAQYGLYGLPAAAGDASVAAQTSPQYAYPSTSAESYYSPAPSNFDTAPAQPSAPYAQSMPYDPAAYGASDRYAWAPQIDASPSDLPAGQVPQSPSVISQMLDESPNHGVPSAYPATPSPDCGFDVACGLDEAGCATAWKPCWYGSVSWLTLGRDDPNPLWTSYETGNNANQLSTNVDLEWGNGGEVVVGRTYSCGRWMLEGTYWQLSPQTGEVGVTHASTVSTPLDFTDVVYANAALAGVLPESLFDGAAEHRVWRRSKIHNIEFNMIRNRNAGVPPCVHGWDLDWSIGVRYFRFEEDWAFRSLQLGGSWFDPTTVGHLEDHIANSLVGFQFGLDVHYQCFRKVRLFAKPKFGIYNNHITNAFLAYRGDGENFAPDAASGVAGTFPVRSSTDTIAFLTELDLGLQWQFRPRWNATVGYRVIVATGIGLAHNQVPAYVVDVPEIASIDTNGDLVLHGAFAGLTFNY